MCKLTIATSHRWTRYAPGGSGNGLLALLALLAVFEGKFRIPEPLHVFAGQFPCPAFIPMCPNPPPLCPPMHPLKTNRKYQIENITKSKYPTHTWARVPGQLGSTAGRERAGSPGGQKGVV